MPAAGSGPGSAPGPGPNQQSQQQSNVQDAAALKLTRGTSCVLCQQRKVRCDKNKPCANCVKAKVECRVVPPQPPRRRKKRLQEKDLIERLKRYESLLAENGVKFDAIGHDLRTDGSQLDDVDELENDFEGLKTTPEASSSPSGMTGNDRGPTGAWFNLHREFRASEQLLDDSSETEEEKHTGSFIHRAFDKMFDNHDGFPFVVGGRAAPITHIHPSTIHIFQMWQIYIDNINPLLKITHVPTVQSQVLEATSNLGKAPSNIECLMFAIYFIVVTSLEERDVQRMFHETKKTLLGRYCGAVQQALVNAEFMRDSDIITLQAFLLYLHCVRWFTDPRQVFCLVGLAVRIAQRMGLHRDPGGVGLPPFEVELRRRLWWTIVGYDRRMGEITGSTVTALSSGGDCKVPLNVNDNELHIEGQEMPKPHSGPTEMLFALTRIEIAMAVANNSNRDSLKVVEQSDKAGASPLNAALNKNYNGPLIYLAGQDSPAYTLDGFCAHVEGTYLTHCDPKIPLHFFTLTMTRQALCKMRVIGFLVRMHNSEAMPLKDVERDSLFLQATQMIEYDNVVQSSESLQPFKWYSMHHFPFPAYMFLVQELRMRVTGPMVERAWEAIIANHDLRGLLSNLHSPMHQAFGTHFVKAWAAHEAAQASAGKHVTMPAFIATLQERNEKKRKARAESRVDQSSVNFSGSQHSDANATAATDPGSIVTPPRDSNAPTRQGYNDAANFQGFNNSFGDFGPTMPAGMAPMGGGMPPMGPMGPLPPGSMGGPPAPSGGPNMYGN